MFDELKPCKCGGNAMFISEQDLKGQFYYCYVCEKCNTHTGGSKKVATAKYNWNKEMEAQE